MQLIARQQGRADQCSGAWWQKAGWHEGNGGQISRVKQRHIADIQIPPSVIRAVMFNPKIPFMQSRDHSCSQDVILSRCGVTDGKASRRYRYSSSQPERGRCRSLSPSQSEDRFRKDEDRVRSAGRKSTEGYQSVGQNGSPIIAAHHPCPDRNCIPVNLYSSGSRHILAFEARGKADATHKKLDGSCMVRKLTSRWGVHRSMWRRRVYEVLKNLFEAIEQRNETGLFVSCPVVVHSPDQIGHVLVPPRADLGGPGI